MAILKTLPDTTKKEWDGMKKEKDLHPGLTFYRFMEMDDEGKYDKDCLNDFPSRTSIPHVSALTKRMEDQVQWLENNGGWAVRTFRATLLTRMAVGMGIPSVTENGLYLDHTHGVPVIPGSVLKGVAQDFVLLQGGVLHETDENWKYKRENTVFAALFGAQTPPPKRMDEHFQTRRGQVIFFDAFPTSSANPFEIDIMNPHYGDYYGDEGDTPPADYLNPNPILFLTVKAGTEFLFALAARAELFTPVLQDGTKGAPFDMTSEELVKKARDYLKGAVTELGVGGKTRVGYGLFANGGNQ